MEYPFVAMKRWLAKIGVFLLLGAIVDVAVAWGCAVTGPHHFMLDDERWLSDQEASELWYLYMGEIAQHEEVWGYPASATRSTYITLRSVPSSSIDIPVASAGCLIVQAGLPLRSFEGGEYFRRGWDEDKRWNENLVSLRPAIWTERTIYWFGQIPTRPLWPGFAINTVFYAAALWMLTLGPFTARRVIRRRRGVCIKCGYDLRGTAQMICSECGHEVRAEART